ncbi:MAG: hypothetical protein IJH34_04000 [Romboutsia sp.]|nr:hypothetical protein [Romboutsia sp.]
MEILQKIDMNLLMSMGFAILAVVFFLKSLFSLSSEFVNYGAHKRRLKQLRFNKRRDLNTNDLVDSITDIVDSHIFKSNKPKDLKQIEKKLILAGWDKTFTPLQYKAVNVFLKLVGLAFLVIFGVNNIWLGLFMGAIPAFAMEILLANTISQKKDQILVYFPELISIIQGYLEAGIPLIEAISYACPFAGEAWGPLLEKLVVDSEINSIEYALDELKRRIDILEVKEFASLVKLAYVQGSNVVESFEAQSKRMDAIKFEYNQMKIQKRRSMGVMVQMPMLLMIFVAFGLPIVPQLGEMFSAM